MADSFTIWGTAGTGKKKRSLKRALEPREDAELVIDNAERYTPRCVTCLGPREPHRHPVCDDCRRRKQQVGL